MKIADIDLLIACSLRWGEEFEEAKELIVQLINNNI